MLGLFRCLAAGCLTTAALVLSISGVVLGCRGGDGPTGSGARDASSDGRLPFDSGMADGAAEDGRGSDAGPDASEADSGPTRGICEACTDHAECGSSSRCIALTSGARACVPACNPDIPDCPRSFDCVLNFSAPDTTTCVPIGDRCCFDDDADGYGDGLGCLGRDCNDVDIAVKPGAPELCNGRDDDCDGLTDDLAIDCGDEHCRSVTAGYEQVPRGSCSTDGMCVVPAPLACGNYTCDGGSDVGDACATTCLVGGRDDDGRCVGGAHCDDVECILDIDNGSVCDEDSDCVSEHCDNEVCCDSGICCRDAADCPTTGGLIATCDSTGTCQGSRGEALCTSYVCSTRSGVPDDSGCGPDVEANTCGYFKSVYCSGDADQPVPSCATTCAADGDCDSDAHCDVVCVPDLADGEICDEGSDCVSEHCGNNICCASGDCCSAADDCPASYSMAPLCDTPTACQGSRDSAACVANMCMTAANVPDDSACTMSVLANDCGSYPSVYCDGTTDQPAPACAAGCTSDVECDSDAHCDSFACVPDLGDGRMCDEDTDCLGGHCQNGYCCASGDCCAAASDCSPATYGEVSSCVTSSSCQGHRKDPACNASSSQCELGVYTDDDSGCVGLLANACGNYPSVSCTAESSQPSDQLALCATGCASDANCDPGAYCNGSGVCVADGNAGDPCTVSRECASGLSCVDSVCCTSSCTGTCVACNVAGSLGTCTAVPSGMDPANECAGVGCSSYYSGWGSSEKCYRRSDAPASSVSCNGSRACQTAANVCPSRGAGSVQIDCNDQCQDPTGGTCTGTTAGSCSNYTPSPNTQSCGVGACQRSTAICSSGAPVMCTPGSPGTESCNDIDDDCDGSTDDGLAQDTYEYNNTCTYAEDLGDLGSIATGSYPTSVTVSPTLYGSGDVDVFRVDFIETDSSCGCSGWGATDEDYAITASLTVPSGAGSYEVCNQRDSCGTSSCVTVAAGRSGSLQVWKDGCCFPVGCLDSGTWYIAVRGVGAPGYECSAYTLTASVQQGCR